jgi:SAM-dependent methyltransferase
MTAAALSRCVAVVLPEPVKAPLRRWTVRLAPRKLWLTAQYHVGRFRRTDRKLAGLHLGCGGTILAGFCNVDVRFGCPCDLVARVDRLKLADNSVARIYCSHVFEHLPRARSEAVLREWRRVLEPGGTLHLACPDLEALCGLYLEHLPRYDEPVSQSLVDDLAGIFYGGQSHPYNFHCSGWSFATLKGLMEAAGFRQVRRFDPHELAFRPFRDGSFASLGGRLVSLNVEAVK